MWTKLVSWLSGTRFGNYAIGALTFASAILSIYLSGRSAGKDKERTAQDRKTLENINQRIKIDDELAKSPDSDNRKRLSKWVPKQ